MEVGELEFPCLRKRLELVSCQVCELLALDDLETSQGSLFPIGQIQLGPHGFEQIEFAQLLAKGLGARELCLVFLEKPENPRQVLRLVSFAVEEALSSGMETP